MKKNITIILLSCTLLVSLGLNVRQYNGYGMLFWYTVGWASIAGRSGAYEDFYNNAVKLDHFTFENAKNSYLDEEYLIEIDIASWTAFTSAYRREIEKLQNPKTEVENE